MKAIRRRMMMMMVRKRRRRRRRKNKRRSRGGVGRQGRTFSYHVGEAGSAPIYAEIWLGLPPLGYSVEANMLYIKKGRYLDRVMVMMMTAVLLHLGDSGGDGDNCDYGADGDGVTD